MKPSGMAVSSPELEPHQLAAILARKATEDAIALREFESNPEIADSILGFHAQQAIEKWLKGVLASRCVDFEYTHDLRRLIELIENAGITLPLDTREVVMFTEFAVPLRYEDLLDAEPLDRRAAVALVNEVGVWAQSLLNADDQKHG
jgi:HEPN domain-containing protein